MEHLSCCSLDMAVVWVAFLSCCFFAVGGSPDPRYLPNGKMMLESDYLDQPYCVIDSHLGNRWVCVVTQDAEHEGGLGERVVRWV